LRRLRLLLIVASAIVSLVTLANPAGATSAIAYHGNDWGRTIGYFDDTIAVCDAEADNRTVWAEYKMTNGATYSLWDVNGANNGCVLDDFWVDTPYRAREIRICEYEGGCGAPVRTRWY
jgi:hypothetical protein